MIIYLMARAVPRVDDEISKPAVKLDRLFDSLRLEKLDAILSNFLEKFLRKVKLFLMKLDNLTNNYLDKVKQTKSNGNGQKDKEEKPSLFNSNHQKEEDSVDIS